jgi:hypothetical protein
MTLSEVKKPRVEAHSGDRSQPRSTIDEDKDSPQAMHRIGLDQHGRQLRE